MANGTLAISQLEMLSQSGTGIITITPPATNTNRAITLPDAAGAIVVSGTTPSLNGITFPASQSASAGANTLDDYEEGTWTPSLGGNTTYIVQTGAYTKVGQLVFVRGILIINVIGTGSTTQISGLPFANASGGICAMPCCGFFASATAVASFFAGITNGGSVININSLVIAGTTDGSNAIFGNNAQFQFSGCYSV